jgi:hypothetical protein
MTPECCRDVLLGLRLAPVVEFLLNPRPDLLCQLRRVETWPVALRESQEQREVLEVRADGGRYPGVLDLDSDRPAVLGPSPETWPIEAAATGRSSNSVNTLSIDSPRSSSSTVRICSNDTGGA